MTTRRSFLAGMLASFAAPAIITTPGLLMPVRKIVVPELIIGRYEGFRFIESQLAYQLMDYGQFVVAGRLEAGPNIPKPHDLGLRVLDADCARAFDEFCMRTSHDGRPLQAGETMQLPYPVFRLITAAGTGKL